MTKYWLITSDSIGLYVQTYDSMKQATDLVQSIKDRIGARFEIIYVVDSLPVERWSYNNYTQQWRKTA